MIHMVTPPTKAAAVVWALMASVTRARPSHGVFAALRLGMRPCASTVRSSAHPQPLVIPSSRLTVMSSMVSPPTKAAAVAWALVASVTCARRSRGAFSTLRLGTRLCAYTVVLCAALRREATRARSALHVLVAPCSLTRSCGCPGEAPKVAVPLDWRRIPRPRRIGPSPGSSSSHTRRLGECQSWRPQTAAKAGRFQSDRAGGAAGLPGEAPNPKFVLFGPRCPFRGRTGALDGSKIARTRRLWGGRSWRPSSQAKA